MVEPIAQVFEDYLEEGQLVGDMLLGYIEIESYLADLVGAVNRAPLVYGVRVLFRVWRAEDRIAIADAIIRPFFTRHGLIGPYGQWYGALRRCKEIRNRYAHCIWGIKDDRLGASSLEDAARSHEGYPELPFYPVDLALLKKQHAYFAYAADLGHYLLQECHYLNDRRRTRDREALPKSKAAPPLDNRPKAQKG